MSENASGQACSIQPEAAEHKPGSISFGVLLTAKTEENIMMVSSPFELHLIFPLLHVLGANGILLEYEDMYPYDGELKPLRANDAYSPSEVKEILKLAKSHDLEVIPLIQTFGHMENFATSGSGNVPNTVNPHKEDSLKLVIAMIEQVMALHDDLRWFHIGCDEVMCITLVKGRIQGMAAARKNTIEKLCLAHMKAVASHIVSTHPTVKPIVWDDMLRRMSKETLR
ncbi:hypothetical protein E2320_015678, partial [Naja naja]